MKFTKTNERQVEEFLGKADQNGCLPVSEWVNGSGNYITKKALPPFTARYERKNYAPTCLPEHGTPARVAYDYLAKPENKRKKCVLVMDTHELYKFLFACAHGQEMNRA